MNGDRGRRVRLIEDIEWRDEDNSEICICAGTVFYWNDDAEYQIVDGMLVFIDESEMEDVEE